MSIWSRLTGGIAALGVGGAAGAAFEPAFEVPRQEAWKAEPNRVLDLGTLAHLVAQGLITEEAAEGEAARSGYRPERLRALVQLNLRAPDVAEALALWRRGRITEAQVDHVLAKAQIEEQYHAAIKELEFTRLDPAIIATAIQRGIMRDPGFLPVEPPSGAGKVRPFPVSGLDPLAEALASGVNEERLFVETALVGLPASPDLAARMTFRGIIDRVDFARAIAEGNTRNEWADALFEGFREILTARQYAELHLRGWITEEEMLAGTAKHGMSAADAELLFKVLGRPIPEHQVVTGEARGGVYDGPIDHIPAAFLAALRQSNIRPEWYNLAYANRYSYPSAFVLRSLTQAGDISEAEAHQILLNIGWPPDLAATVSAHWAGGTAGGGTADPLVKKAHTQLWTAAHKAYVDFELSEAQATETLQALGALDPAAVLALWDRERMLVRRELTPAQVKKAYVQMVLTEAEATAKLEQLGMSPADVHTFLHT